jgi:hypothetical protein
MSQGLIIVITLGVLVGVMIVLMGSLVWHIMAVRRSGPIGGLWRTFGLSLAFCGLFFVSWLAQGIAEWGSYRAEQRAHGEQATLSGYTVEFGQSTLENWQSEFLQLFSFVVLSALLIHRGSAESKDSDERMEEKIDKIAKRLDELEPTNAH